MSDDAVRQQLLKDWEKSAFPELIEICAEDVDAFVRMTSNK